LICLILHTRRSIISLSFLRMLGTVMVCGLLEAFLSLLPRKTIKKIFPPLVTSVTIMLIGIALTGTGMKYWGGGVVCAEMGWKQHCEFSTDPIMTCL